MKQILAIVLLTVLLAGCDSPSANSAGATSGDDYAQHLRDLANGQPGDQVPTEAQPAPTIPAPPQRPAQVVALPTPQTIATVAPQPASVTANIGRAVDLNIDDGLASLTMFVTSPVVMFALAATVAGLAMRKKVRQ